MPSSIRLFNVDRPTSVSGVSGGFRLFEAPSSWIEEEEERRKKREEEEKRRKEQEERLRIETPTREPARQEDTSLFGRARQAVGGLFETVREKISPRKPPIQITERRDDVAPPPSAAPVPTPDPSPKFLRKVEEINIQREKEAVERKNRRFNNSIESALEESSLVRSEIAKATEELRVTPVDSDRYKKLIERSGRLVNTAEALDVITNLDRSDIDAEYLNAVIAVAQQERIGIDYKEPGFWGQINEGINESLANMMSSFGSALEYTGHKIGIESLAERGEGVRDHFQGVLSEHPEWKAPADMGKWTDPNFYARLVGGGIPSLLSAISVPITAALATTAVTGNPLIGTGVGIVTGFTYMAALEGGTTYQEAKEMGATEEQAQRMGEIVGVINGSLELAFPGWLVFRDPAKGGILRSISRNVVKGFLIEGGEEFTQEMVSNAVAKAYDENRGLFDNTLESFVGGGLLGALMGGTFPENIDVRRGQTVNDVARMLKEGPILEQLQERISKDPVYPSDDAITILGQPKPLYYAATKGQTDLDFTKISGLTGGVAMGSERGPMRALAETQEGEVWQYGLKEGARVIDHSVLEKMVQNVDPSKKVEVVKEFLTDSNIDAVNYDVPEQFYDKHRIIVVNPKIMEKTSDVRSAHQLQLEQAQARHDWPEMEKVLDAMDESDPYKKPMESLFRPLIERYKNAKIPVSNLEIVLKIPKEGGEIPVFRGEGGTRASLIKEAHALGGRHFFGEGTYVELAQLAGERYGKPLKGIIKIKPEEILKISSESEHTALVADAIDTFPDLFDIDKQIPAYAKSKGYKAIVGIGEPMSDGGMNIIDDSVFTQKLQSIKTLEELKVSVEEVKVREAEKVAEKVEKEPAKKIVRKAPEKVEVERKAKVTPVTKVITKIVPKKPDIPILGNVAVRAGQVFFTDLNIWGKFDQEGLEEGIYDLVGIDFHKTEKKLEDFPSFPEISEEVEAEIPMQELIDALQEAGTFASTSDAVPVFQGALLNAKDGVLNVVSSDRFRVNVQQRAIGGDADFQVVLADVKQLADTVSALQGETARLKLSPDDFVAFEGDTGLLTVREITGEYPDIANVYKEMSEQYVINKADLSAALNELRPYAPGKDGDFEVIQEADQSRFLLKATKDGAVKKVYVSYKPGQTKYKGGQTLPGTLLMPRLTEGDIFAELNRQFLVDSIKHIPGDTVYLSYQDKGSPLFLSNQPKVDPIDFVLTRKEVEEKREKPKKEIPGKEKVEVKEKEKVEKEKPVKKEVKKEEPEKPPEKIPTEEEGKPLTYSDDAATVGIFADTPVETGGMGEIKPLEFPELVRLARDLIGTYPTTKKFPKAIGKFYPTKGAPEIKLNRKIFEDADDVQKIRILAHEIGHLTDFLPEETLARGNLLGRLQSLQNFMSNTFGETTVTDKELRNELWEWSKFWRPFDEAKASKNFLKYRKSAVELYADAISGLLASPGTLEKKAPTFYREFFDQLDNKPQVKEEFYKLWELLSYGPEEVLKERSKDIRGGFERAEDEWRMMLVEKKARKRNFWFEFRYDFVDRNTRIIDKVNQAVQEGAVVSDDENPAYLAAAYNYVNGLVKNWIETEINPSYLGVQEDGMTWEDLGELLLLERIRDERKEIANPFGFTVKTAEDNLGQLKNELGDDKYGKLLEHAESYRIALKNVLKQAYEAGLYSQEKYEEMRDNPSYATFSVVDYLSDFIPATIYKQVGTLKEIANPATASVMKTISTIRAAEKNKSIQSWIKLNKEAFPDEIEEARTRWNGKYHEPIESRDETKKLLTVMEKGKITGYYVDPYVASAYKHYSVGRLNTALSALRLVQSKALRPMYITFNTGFQTFNLIRDFVRFYKNTPNLSLIRAVRRYGQAVKPSLKRAWEISDETIAEMEKAKILNLTFNDILSGLSEEDKQIERIMQKYDLSSLNTPKKNFFVTPFVKILNFISRTGNFIETLPKVAGYYELQGKLPPQEMAQFIRTAIGSPDFLAKGEAYRWSNEVLLFSNAVAQGVRSDYNVAFNNPKTRSGYWMKTAMLTLLPKLLMFAALYGLGGEWLKKAMEDASEYDKTNYNIIPLGRDNGKTIYLRIPQDETGRLIGGVFWKSLKGLFGDDMQKEDLTNLLAFTGGQVPSLSPILDSMRVVGQFLVGQNPQDFFRGRNIIPEEAFEAGGEHALKPLALWLFQNLGGGVFWTYYVTEQSPGTESWRQKALRLPVISNIVGRWVKISDYGQKEISRRIKGEESQKAATQRLEEKKLINSAVKDYQTGAENMVRKFEIERELIQKVLDIQPEGTDSATRKRKATNTQKSFRISILRGEADPYMNELIYARSNAEKEELLKSYKKRLSKEQYDDLIRTALEYKVVSENVVRAVR